MMLKKIGIVIALTFLTINTIGHTDVRYKIYPFESGVVKYEHSGMMKGTYIIYFDNWGLRQALYMKTQMDTPDNPFKMNHFTLIDGEWEYSIDMDTMTGMKIKNKPFETNVEKLENKDVHRRDIVKWFELMGGKKIGQEEILGKTCDIYETYDPKTGARLQASIWKKIDLHSKRIVGGPVNRRDDSHQVRDRYRYP